MAKAGNGLFRISNDTLPPLPTDTLRWQDVIFEKDGGGSINTKDTIFRKRYYRSYFSYKPGTAKGYIGFKKFPYDNTYLFPMKNSVSDTKTVLMYGLYKSDSLFVELKKVKTFSVSREAVSLAE